MRVSMDAADTNTLRKEVAMKWLGVTLFLALVPLLPASTQSQFDDLFNQDSWNEAVQQATADIQRQLDEQARLERAIAEALAYKPPL